MDDVPLTPEELERLVQIDLALRDGVAASDALSTNSLTPPIQSLAKTLHSLNKNLSTTLAQSYVGMPQSIGKYRIRSVIGVGGYGIVYLAHDPSLHRSVAIKVPLPGRIHDESSRQRFLKEVKATAKLEHPNIVPVFDAGIDGEEVYLVLAHCPGPSLDDWLKSIDRPLAPTLASKILKMLANAIEYSHRQGIIHRDLKPGNVLLFDDPSSELVGFPYLPKIADFGLAKLLDDTETKTASLQLQGTPQYMAPEQLVQRKRLSTPAIDVYALGVLLYRMLVGRTPFQFESIEEAVRKIEFETPVYPHVIQTNVPRDLSWIAMKCLEKRPQDRYASAGELAEDLENYVHRRPVSACAPSVASIAKHWCRQHPVIALLLAAATILVSTFGALEYRYSRNVLSVNNALQKSQGQLLDQDLKLKEKIRELNQSLETSENQQRELERRDVYSKQLIYVADVAAAARAVSEKDPNRAVQTLAPYFTDPANPQAISIVPEFAAKHLWSHLRPTRRSFPKDTQTLWTVSVSPDGSTVAAAGNQGNIVLHDTRKGIESNRTLRSEQVEINGLSFSRDGRLLGAARDDGVIAIWDVAKEQLVRTFKAISGEAYSVRFLGDSHTCAVAGRGNEIFIWDADTGELVRSLLVTLDKPVVECLEVSDDGKFFAVGGTDGHAHILDVQGNHQVSFRTWAHASVNTVCLVPNGPGGRYSLVLADKLGKLTVCNESGGEAHSLSVPDPIQSIVYLGEGRLLCGDKGGGLSLVQMMRDEADTQFVELRLIQQWAHHGASLQAMVLDRSRSQASSEDPHSAMPRPLIQPVYSVSRTGELYCVDLKNDSPKFAASRVQDQPGSRADFVDMEEDGSEVCLVTGEKIEWIEIPSGERCSIETGRKSELASVAKIPGTDQWLVGNAHGETTRVDRSLVGTGKHAIEWKTIFPESEFAQLQFHPNSKWYLAIGGTIGYPLCIRDSRSDELIYESKGCRSAAFSRDGLRLAVGRASTNHVDILDTTTWQLVATLKKHRSTVSVMEFTNDGQWLVSCSDDRTACFWDTDTWELKDTVALSGTFVTSMTISPDSRTLVVCDLAGRITLWDMKTRRELMMLRPEGPLVLKVKFVGDGSKLFAWDGLNELEIFETLEKPFRVPNRNE